MKIINKFLSVIIIIGICMNSIYAYAEVPVNETDNNKLESNIENNESDENLAIISNESFVCDIETDCAEDVEVEEIIEPTETAAPEVEVTIVPTIEATVNPTVTPMDTTDILLTNVDFYASTDKGDVNNDSVINALDALLILKYAAKISAIDNISIADLDNDGNVDAEDALKVLYIVAKLDGTPSYTPEPTAPVAYMLCTDSSGSKEQSFKINVVNNGKYENVKNVKVAVWSNSEGQDDIKWYTMDKKTDTVWERTVFISDHSGIGTYHAHAYVTLEDGSQKLACNSNFTITTPEFATEIGSYDSQNGTFVVKITPKKVPSGVKEVKVPVWCKSDQSDIKWYVASKKSDGTYSVTIETVLHDFHIGEYHVHAYLTDNNGNRIGKVAGSCTVTKPDIAINYITSKNLGNGQYEVRIFYPNNGNVTSVQFPTWSNANGQDDIKWYTGTNNGDGSWSAIIQGSNHFNAGNFSTHVYGVINEQKKLLGSISYSVAEEDIMTEAERKINTYVNQVYNQVGRDLNACYWWCVNNLSYKKLPVPYTPPAGYTSAQWYANYAFENRQGNCFCYAAAFYWLAKGLGYDVEYIEGQVGMAAGGYGPHGWVIVTIDGVPYICDPEAQDEVPRRNFYMQPLGNTQFRYKW